MTKSFKKSGMAALIGRSNVGKSTLINALVGTKIAITTPKPQTTRHVIHGVVHDDRGQIVFVDTPGIFRRVPDTVTAKMNEKARDALLGIDVVVYVVDPTRHVGEEEESVHMLVRNAKQKKILAINKSDLKQPFLDEYLSWRDEFDETIELSAKTGKNISLLKDTIFSFLPSAPALYDTHQITNIENEFWVAEIIREKTFLHLSEEIPYTTTVEVHDITRNKDGMVIIQASIVTNASRYKKMIIGSNGRRIKEIGITARKELELVSGDKVYLELDVVVDEDWMERFE